MKHWLLPIALTVAGAATSAHGAQSCDELRTQIESKIAASGVARFTVTVVDANASASGQVVGTCELGSKKVVYEKGAGPDRGTAPAPASGGPLLTECKDGTVSVGGDCKK
ncbi:DUF1161 domain-containing protein [Variovorax sp. H27-G14]|uniref:DUF1161 domain-containing protein n=1 Tax=Variovorax sp. H27-G14 TaxID=3111914 RepID=UPI0038FD275A